GIGVMLPQHRGDHEVAVRIIAGDLPQRVEGNLAFSWHHHNLKWRPLGRPRAQSAAGMGRLPGGCSVDTRTSAVAVPTQTASLVTRIWPGASSASWSIVTGWILRRSWSKVVHAPGAGVQPRICRSTANAGRFQSILASSAVSLD